jgi:hypothetical protein
LNTKPWTKTHTKAMACWLIKNYLLVVQLIIHRLWWCQEGHSTLMFHCHMAFILEVNQTSVACTLYKPYWLRFWYPQENWLETLVMMMMMMMMMMIDKINSGCIVERPLQRRIEYTITQYRLILHTDQPSYLRDLLFRYLPTRSLRSSDKNLLILPSVKSDMGKSSFSYAASAVWNSLPLDLRNSSTLSTFLRHLENVLFPP